MTKRHTAVTVASAACLALVLPAVKKSEGYWPTVKVDTVGTGRPCTGGYGETENVKCGETHSESYWSERLKLRLADEYDREIGKCIHVELPDSVRAAAITTAYNAGSAAVCKSPMVAKWNAGDFRGGCEALLTKVGGKYTGWYITARRRVLPGLIHRRADDKKMCLSGLDKAPYVCTPAQAEAGECLSLVIPPKVCGGEWVDDHTYTSHPECRKPAASFCSGSGQGADCPRNAHTKHRPLPKPRPAAPRPWYWWIFK